MANDSYDAEEAQEQIDLVLREAGNPLGNFISDFHTATNTLAGKKSTFDRGVEQATNRKFYSVMSNLSRRTSANMVAGSISSAITNIIPITQSWGEVSPISSLKAMSQTIASAYRNDGVVEKSDFLTNRLNTEENLYQTTWDKIGKGVGILMESLDNFTSQVVWRSKYMENISKGMSESDAIKNADDFAESVIAGRSRGNMPTIFDSKNPLAKVLTAFQLEVSNQYGYMFKDMPNDLKNEGIAKLVKGYFTMFIGAYAYNALSSAITGRDSAFDPIRIIEGVLRDIGLIGDDEEEPEDIVLNLVENVSQELPFVGGLLGGGRIPIQSALPYDGDYKQALSDIVEGDWKSVAKELSNPLYYLAPPMGGGQIRKTIQGLSMFSDEHPVSGSYTDSGKLRFPVEDNLANRFQAALFGQYASANAREYFDKERTPLSEKQIEEYKASEMTIGEYWDYREGLSGLSTMEEKAAYINSLDIPVWKKNLLMSNLSDRKNQIDMGEYASYGSVEEMDFATENPERYNLIKQNGLSYEGYKALNDQTKNAYTWAAKNPDKYDFITSIGYTIYDYANATDEAKDAWNWAYNNPRKYEVSKVVSDDLFEYRGYTSEMNDIKADKDANGNSINGSRKQKVIDYINNLDLDYGAKIILYRGEYPSDNTYNSDILNYLNSRNDITYDQKVTILTELGFKVSGNNVTW